MMGEKVQIGAHKTTNWKMVKKSSQVQIFASKLRLLTKYIVNYSVELSKL